MTTFDAALIKEQGVRFAVVSVKDSVTSSPTKREAAARRCSALFDGAPVVLVSSNGRTWGRTDLVRFLRNVPLEALPWKRWRLN